MTAGLTIGGCATKKSLREGLSTQDSKVSGIETQVEAKDGVLTVSATREREEKEDNGKFHRYERRFGTFSRSIGLPQGVSEDDIKASYVNGVLEISVPKPEQPKPKRIEVAVPGGQPVIEADTQR